MYKFHCHIVVFIIFLTFACTVRNNNILTIAAAANLRPAMENILPAFEEDSGIACELIFGSSGKLAAQIVEGAPFDLLLSADLKYPMIVYNEGMAIDSPELYGFGKLVLWTIDNDLPADADLLLSDKLSYLAIANPLTAPYGLAAENYLRNSQYLNLLSDKLVYGESVAQANQFLLTGAADACITSLSSVQYPGSEGQGSWVILDTTLYEPIGQYFVVVGQKSPKREMALLFKEFLLSEKSQTILRQCGYTIPE